MGSQKSSGGHIICIVILTNGTRGRTEDLKNLDSIISC